jgi:TolB protein
MIVRAFRLTDRLGNAALKTLAWLGQILMTYVQALAGTGAEDAGEGIVSLAWLLGIVATGLSVIASVVIGVFAFLFGIVWSIGQRISGGSAQDGGLPRPAFIGRRTAPAEEQRRFDNMVSRAEELADKVVLVEDPLKARNRTLSALLVVTLASVVILLVWATSSQEPAPPVLQPAVGVVAQVSPNAQMTPFATAVPTVTPRPEVLRVGGSLVYTVRDGGQDDLWVSVIGFEDPIQITSTFANERMPAWSPDGRYLAFASDRDGNWEVYVQDVRTGSVTRMTYTPGFEGSPAWSPDGQWLVYEAYTEDNLDIFITRIDGTQGPIRLTFDPAPDFSPVWAPGGREIAYVSLREGNNEIFILSLDDPSEGSAVNLTISPEVNEEKPAWSPDGMAIAYSALVDGLEIVYVKETNDLSAEPIVIDRGQAPAWAPDGDSLIYALDQGQRTLLVAGQYKTIGVASQALALHAPATDPDWTAWRPQSPSGGAAQAAGLFSEEITFVQDEPPYYRLMLLNEVEAPSPYLSDRVNDSFAALRQAVLAATGEDYLGSLEDAFWALDRPPDPGQDRLNWHLTGRAISLNRNLIQGFPPPIEVVREDIGVHTYWRVYARAAIQDGRLGEPLRALPWDFSARRGGDVEAYDEGGRLRSGVPAGYYVDLTQIFADYGWTRLPADRSWRYNFGGVLFWEFVNHGGMTWEEAMLEIYSTDELANFLSVPTAFPTSTLAPPTSTPAPSRTPTPVPPDQQS